jgi:hypothetical protein
MSPHGFDSRWRYHENPVTTGMLGFGNRAKVVFRFGLGEFVCVSSACLTLRDDSVRFSLSFRGPVAHLAKRTQSADKEVMS